MQTAPGSRGPQAPAPAPPTVPERLREKILAIDIEKLAALDPVFCSYAKLVVAQAEGGQQPDQHTLAADIRHLPLVVEMENQRNPGLNLHVCRNAADCFKLILEKEQAAGPGDFRVVYSPDKMVHTGHHIALDVRTAPGKPTTIIGYESALEMSTEFYKEDLESHIPNVRVTFVHNLIQSSNHDCVMFALNNALKSFKTRGDFALQAHRRTMGAALDVIPRKEVPAVFKKHSHSRDVIDHEPLQAEAIVSKAKTGDTAESLTQRIHAYRTRRPNGDYSTSIEGFRLQEIKRVQDHLTERAGRRQTSAPSGLQAPDLDRPPSPLPMRDPTSR